MEITILTMTHLQNNCYICSENGSAFVVDPGYDGEGIYRRIQADGLKLAFILLTHGHFDHIGGVEELRRLSGAELYAHAEEEEILCSPNKNYGKGSQYILKKPERLLGDGEIIDFHGNKIEVFHTPGHTKGCVCYIVGDIIFTGDTLFHMDIGRTDLYSANPAQMEQSIERIKALYKERGDFKVLPGHEESSTLLEEVTANPYFL